MVIEMKKAKLKNKIETKEIEMESEYSVRNLIKILIIIILCFCLFYSITVLFLSNRENKVEENPVIIDSSNIIFSQLLNRKENEYYVLATKLNENKSIYMDLNYNAFYKEYIYSYKQLPDSLEFYYIDLDSALNKSNFKDELNITSNISELTINDDVLFKIKDGKIEKTYIGREKILDKLSRL